MNFEAGAETPAAGAFTAVGIALATLFLTPLLFFLPNATLAATIVVAVLSLVDLGALKRTWVYSKADFAAMAATILVTLVEGVEAGLVVGVGLVDLPPPLRTSRPHVAVVGQIPGTAHFRNVARHAVVTDPEILSLRVDESLYFPNARFIEDLVNEAVAANPAIRHVILECPAVNTIDTSALESLEAINHRLKDGGITFHLSEVKGPVMDRLKRSHFLQELTGKVHLSQYDAVASINPDLARRTAAIRAAGGWPRGRRAEPETRARGRSESSEEKRYGDDEAGQQSERRRGRASRSTAERVDRLKEQHMSTPQEIDFERIRIMAEVYEGTAGYQQIIRRAKFFATAD